MHRAYNTLVRLRELPGKSEGSPAVVTTGVKRLNFLAPPVETGTRRINIPPDRVVAYFQSIVSADTNDICAFEALGRVVNDDGTVASLGPFFSDRNVSGAEALLVDRLVRKYALKKYLEENISGFLFLNINPGWLAADTPRPKITPTIKWVREYGLEPENIVIEIAEEEFEFGRSHLNLLTDFKNAGFKIALDDYGKKASNFNRLAAFRPDIIKIDKSYIHNSETSHYCREFLRSLASFAEAVGIKVVYEGVETRRQLDICLEIKGMYFQGYLFATPQPSMRNAAVNRSVFTESASNAPTAIIPPRNP